MLTSFTDLRHDAHLSRAACADYFKVNLSTINRWDNGAIPAPFAVLELLRVIAGGLPALSLRDNFKGWHFGGEFIYTPDGGRFTDTDIKGIRILQAQAADYRNQIHDLKNQVAALSDDKEDLAPQNVIQFSKYARSD